MYFLVDGIYPSWSIFAKTNAAPITPQEKYYKERQEHIRKDVERCFGVLVKKFTILNNPLKLWYLDEIQMMMQTCVILHNMTVLKRRDTYKFNDKRDIQEANNIDNIDNEEQEREGLSLFAYDENRDDDVINMAAQVAHLSQTVEDAAMHCHLKADLTQHLYNVYRQSS